MSRAVFTEPFTSRAVASDVAMSEIRFRNSSHTNRSQLEDVVMMEEVAAHATDESAWTKSEFEPMDDNEIYVSSQEPKPKVVTSGQQDALKKLAVAGGFNFEELRHEMIVDAVQLERKLAGLLFRGPPGCSSLNRMDISYLLLDAFGHYEEELHEA
mmetsp:Transcript_50335/g.144763  ORF Transcript_50335/g.144763 Transcript_50335/m.144763 type:complete len:156 (-) Transcript_50335:153-620(-)